MGTILRFIHWRLRVQKSEMRRTSKKQYIPDYAVPDIQRIQNPDPSKIQLTWVGHSTFLIQVAGKNILTDPIWSNRASPVSGLGPKRYARPGIAFADLPRIDIVLVSHTHYDHLDRPTIQKLGTSPHYVLPRNLSPWFARLGIRNITELQWWHSADIEGFRVTSVPAKHWSKRNVWGKEGHGWGGYILETPSGTIYFVGDTGYHAEYFKEIGEKFPDIDLALIPIGAYYPEWFFGRYHINPREAVTVHREVGAKKSIGMHWGVFKLTEEPLDEPPLYLARETVRAGLKTDEFSALKIGQTLTL